MASSLSERRRTRRAASRKAGSSAAAAAAAAADAEVEEEEEEEEEEVEASRDATAASNLSTCSLLEPLSPDPPLASAISEEVNASLLGGPLSAAAIAMEKQDGGKNGKQENQDQKE